LKILIKLGGTLLEEQDGRRNIARQLSAIPKEHSLVAVHGGGKQTTQFLNERGVSSRFVGGLRVSDEAVIDAVTKVIAGSVNKQLVAAVLAAGSKGLGLSGVDGLLTTAEQLNPELGFVGRPGRSDGHLLNLLVEAGYLPIIACVAGDENGTIYNVNADSMAVSCAIGWSADLLLFLTDVDGVRGEDGSIYSHLTPEEIEQLIRSGVAHGGMQAKLEAACLGLCTPQTEVIIASGHEDEVCQRVLAGELLGTRITAQQHSVSGGVR
jgi:acetylglutamate kinase